jgi:hypothetical protein
MPYAKSASWFLRDPLRHIRVPGRAKTRTTASTTGERKDENNKTAMEVRQGQVNGKADPWSLGEFHPG